MLTLTGFQDALNAVLVIILVSLILAGAWLSTNVREQPFITTAVVVFQSGVGSEGDNNAFASGAVGRENSSEGTRGGEPELVTPTPVVKENESSVMEVSPEPGTSNGEEESDGGNSRLSEQNNDMTEKGDQSGAEASSASERGLTQCHREGPSADKHLDSSDAKELVNPSCAQVSPSLPENVAVSASEEMEVRNRRLKHFISMGGSQIAGDGHEPSSASREEQYTATPASSEGETLGSSGSGSKNESSPLLSGSETGNRPPGSIKIRLKFLDESQKYVFAQPTERVGSFKRQHFSLEMDANRRIQLIFNGQLLSQDSSTLAHYGLFDNCVVHCHVSQPQQMDQSNGQAREIAAQDDEDAYVTSLLAPLLSCVMVVMWYLRYEYSHLFNTMSTVILLFLTALLLISTYLLYTTQNVPGSDSAAAQIASHQLNTNSLL